MSRHIGSLKVDREKCDGRMACMRVCPTEAIRVRERQAKILEDKCIDCGECIKVCPNRAIVPMTNSFTDFSNFEQVVAIPSPVLFGQFSSEILPKYILTGLKKIGFDDVGDVAQACEAVSMAIREFLANYHGPKPVITAFCPTIVRLIQVRFTELSELLLPIESPMEIAAREAKLVKSRELGVDPARIGAIYLTPCPSKMVAIRSHPRKEMSYLDGAISLADVYGPLLSAISDLDVVVDDMAAGEISGIGLGWPILGGATVFLESKDCLRVSGINDVIRIFEEIEKGKLRDVEFIECLACPAGCIAGSLTVENPYVARRKIMRLLEVYGQMPLQDEKQIKHLYGNKYFSLKKKLVLRPIRPLDEDISQAIRLVKEEQRIFESLPKIDCGACGSPNCMAFAEDVVRGDVEVTGCIFKLMEKRGVSGRGCPQISTEEEG